MNEYLQIACNYINAEKEAENGSEEAYKALREIGAKVDAEGAAYREIVSACIVSAKEGYSYPVFGTSLSSFYGDPEETVSRLAAAGINRFGYAGQSTATMGFAYKMKKAGAEVSGLDIVKKPEEFSYLWREDEIPVLLFTIGKKEA